MRLSTLFAAALPALAMADTSATSATPEAATGTTTVLHTTHLVKTISLSQVHTVTSTACNTTSTWSAPTSAVPVVPTTVPTDKPNAKPNAAGILSGNMVLVGLAGVVAAML